MVAAVISSASESEPLSIAAQQRLARRVARLVPTKLVQCDLGRRPSPKRTRISADFRQRRTPCDRFRV